MSDSILTVLKFCLLALLYVFAFRQGKPPGYDIDLFELWLKGRGFGPETPRESARSSSTSDDHV